MMGDERKTNTANEDKDEENEGEVEERPELQEKKIVITESRNRKVLAVTKEDHFSAASSKSDVYGSLIFLYF